MTPFRQGSDPAGVAHDVPNSDEMLLSVRGLSRREVVALLSGVAMGLTGCGGGSATGPTTTPPPPPPPPPPPGLSTTTGTVALPSGTALPVTSLALKTMGQTVALTSAGTFAVGVSPNAPTLAMVTDASGNGIMAGFLDPTISSAQPITPRSTGVVLTWFSLGGPFLPGDVKSPVLALLNADPAMDALGSVIAQRIAASALAIVNSDAQVAAALTTALAALGGGTAGTSPITGHLDQPPTIAVTPSTDQSGVSVRPATTIVGVTISNSYRRPLMAYVYETQSSTAGTATDYSPARLVIGPIDIGEPSAYTAVGGIRAVLAQGNPFKPYTMNPIALALDGASDQTTYEVVIIGPSSKGVVPAFFTAERYATQVPAWNAAIDAMFARTFFCDLTYALLLEMTGFGSVLPSSPNLVAASASTKQQIGNPFAGTPGLPPTNAVFLSKFNATMTDMLTDPAFAEVYRSVAPSIMDRAEAAALQQLSKVDWQASLKTAANFILKPGSPYDNYKSNGLANVFDDVNRADRGVLWTAVLSKSTATITPANPSIAPGEQVALTVVLSPDLTSTYEFDWTQSSPTATLSAVGENNIGTAINTRQPTVNLMSTASDTGTISLQVLVYDVANNRKALAATANGTVVILLKATLTPAVPVLDVGEQQVFTVTVAGTLPAGAQYIWTLTGTSGSIGAANLVTTTVPTLQYTAVRKGTDTLMVQVADASNHLLAKGSVQIVVDPDGFIDLDIAGTWDPTKQPPDGSYSYPQIGGVREPSPGGGGLDALFLAYDVAADGTIGVLVTMLVPAGSAFRAGQTFTKYINGTTITAGEYNLTLASNLADPANVNSQQWAPVGTGNLTIDSLDQLDDGTFLAQYSFTISNGAGGVITVTGVGTWK